MVQEHPSLIFDHSFNREKIYTGCGRKIVFRKKVSFNKLSENIVGLLKRVSNSDFDPLDSRYPIGICISCKNALLEWSKGDLKRPLPHMPNYQDIVLVKETRYSYNGCNCFICLTARTKGKYNMNKLKVIKVFYRS